jgi:hypothetical protein
VERGAHGELPQLAFAFLYEGPQAPDGGGVAGDHDLSYR